MSGKNKKIKELNKNDLSQIIRSAGVVGAGGAGFPSYIKWSKLDNIQYLLMNLQESEPIFYSDKGLVKSNPGEFQDLFNLLLNLVFDVIVIGSKEKYREKWTNNLEKVTKGSIYLPDDLPVDLKEESGVVFAYTEDVYDYSEEYSLLKVTTDTKISPDLPTEHGWITHNTETIYNIYRAIFERKPVTHKFIHIDGNTPMHRCIHAPIGTPTKDLLKEAGVNINALKKDQILLEGGPGWCSKIGEKYSQFGVSKRTNGILVMDKKTVAENKVKQEEERINLLRSRDWKRRDHEKGASEIKPESVRIPLISNPSYKGKVSLSEPIVNPGDEVSKGQVIAIPNSEGISVPQHSSINGKVRNVTDTHIIINRQ